MISYTQVLQRILSQYLVRVSEIVANRPNNLDDVPEVVPRLPKPRVESVPEFFYRVSKITDPTRPALGFVERKHAEERDEVVLDSHDTEATPVTTRSQNNANPTTCSQLLSQPYSIERELGTGRGFVL